MLKVGIVTINDDDNYGNRLQNYAVQEILKKANSEPITLKNEIVLNSKKLFLLRIPKFLLYRYKKNKERNKERALKFKEFNKNINFSKNIVLPFSKISKKYDFFIAGSDQIWKPTYGRMRDVDFLCFANDNQKISFSASFGISELPENKKEYAKKNLDTFKAISVREDAGKKIVKELTGREDVEVLVDPTMLLSAEEWDLVSKRPEQLKSDKYILNYFLGELPEEWNKEIKRIAKENNCEIINILDKSSQFYKTGPSEFLYLEKNAFLICTDSFHSCVFSIIYDKPFINFNRTDDRVNMNSRLDTLLTKFNLSNRRFKNKITEELLICDYSEAKKILEKEKEKSMKFLKKALEIE